MHLIELVCSSYLGLRTIHSLSISRNRMLMSNKKHFFSISGVLRGEDARVPTEEKLDRLMLL